MSAPVPGQASVTLYLEVADASEAAARAAAAGASLERPVADYPYGRMGVLATPSATAGWCGLSQASASAAVTTTAV